MKHAQAMKISCRHDGKAPTVVEDVQSLRIFIGGTEFEIRAAHPGHVTEGEAGLTIRGEQPLSNTMLVVPGATNMIHIQFKKV